MPLQRAAAGIIELVNEKMFGALRLVSVQQGIDPREYALMAFGGAGPLHANALARLLGSWPVIVLARARRAVCLWRRHDTSARRGFTDAYPAALTAERRGSVTRVRGAGAKGGARFNAENVPAAEQTSSFEVDLRLPWSGHGFDLVLSRLRS